MEGDERTSTFALRATVDNLHVILPTAAHALAGKRERRLAGSTGLEPAASAVTGQRSNQLNYDPKPKCFPTFTWWAVQDSNL
jgi:hypothetical protein